MSIMPCLALRGIGNEIGLSRSLNLKILLCKYEPTLAGKRDNTIVVNGCNDRETSDYDAEDYVRLEKLACHSH